MRGRRHASGDVAPFGGCRGLAALVSRGEAPWTVVGSFSGTGRSSWPDLLSLVAPAQGQYGSGLGTVKPPALSLFPGGIRINRCLAKPAGTLGSIPPGQETVRCWGAEPLSKVAPNQGPPWNLVLQALLCCRCLGPGQGRPAVPSGGKMGVDCGWRGQRVGISPKCEIGKGWIPHLCSHSTSHALSSLPKSAAAAGGPCPGPQDLPWLCWASAGPRPPPPPPGPVLRGPLSAQWLGIVAAPSACAGADQDPSVQKAATGHHKTTVCPARHGGAGGQGRVALLGSPGVGRMSPGSTEQAHLQIGAGAGQGGGVTWAVQNSVGAALPPLWSGWQGPVLLPALPGLGVSAGEMQL